MDLDILTVPAIAERLGVSRTTVYQYRDKYNLPLGRLGRISRQAFEQWLTTFQPPKMGRPKRASRWQWVYR